MSFWAICDRLHQLAIRTVDFHDQLMSDDPDWDDLWQTYLELCRIKEYLKLKEG